MSGAPERGTVPRRQRRHHHHHHHHHHHQKHQKHLRQSEEPEEKRPKVNPIFLWASQREQRIVEVICEDYDKRNRIKLTKTAQGWRSIPRTASNICRGLVATKAASNSSNDEEIGKEASREALDRISSEELPNGRTNGRLLVRESSRRKRNYDEMSTDNSRDYAFSTRIKANWDEERRVVPCSDEDEENEEEETTRFQEDLSRRENLERLQKDRLFQPRVVLEPLHFSQLPEGVHRSILQRRGKDEEEARRKLLLEEKTPDSESKPRRNKPVIQDILNMIDATASPVLATDTPNADLPVDSTKTCEVLDGNSILEKTTTELDERMEVPGDEDRAGSDITGTSEYPSKDDIVDNNLAIREERILEREDKVKIQKDVVVVSLKSTLDTRTCKVAKAGGDVASRPNCRSSGHSKWQQGTSEIGAGDVERPDEPGEPVKIDYSDSSKILNALRNTPGLSVSITRTNTPEGIKTPGLVSSRPSSKASSSSRSPDSQTERVERLLKCADSATEAPAATASPKNLPGLSIIIPNYRYRNPQAARNQSPPTKPRVDSPESTTVNFAKNGRTESKLDGFSHEEDEDDCDSQVLEDLRRQKVDSYEADSEYCSKENPAAQDDRKSSSEAAKSQTHWITSSRNSEAQAKCRYQDVEHFDEQVLEELRSRGTVVVSPQPSGIPCSPASRRPSSAYLERLLPSPPCSVSCSEDAKNDLTLKGILASPSRLETRDYDRPREQNRCDQAASDHLPSVHTKDPDRSSSVRRSGKSFQDRLNVQSQEMRTSGRPMSSGDVHSTYLIGDLATPKRPMSAEWSIGRQKARSSQSKSKVRVQSIEEVCASSTSSDKVVLDPASQLREMIEKSSHLIPNPLLVPRSYLAALAAAPAIEIPKLLVSRPELRLPEALTRPDLLGDPNLLVITLEHLQDVLDHTHGPVFRSQKAHTNFNNGTTNKGVSTHASHGTRIVSQTRPKLSCKPIDTLMPAPIDLSSSRRASPYPQLLRVRSGLLKQEPEVTSTANTPDDSQLWHPLFGSQKRQPQQYQHHQHHQHQQQQHQFQHQNQHQSQNQHASWHRTTLAS